jgi:hypothetical protein
VENDNVFFKYLVLFVVISPEFLVTQAKDFLFFLCYSGGNDAQSNKTNRSLKPSFTRFSFGMNFNEAEFKQYLNPFGSGPSSNT